MKKTRYRLLTILAVVMLTSCGGDDYELPTTLSLSQLEFEFGTPKQQQPLHIKTTGKWSVTAPKNNWCVVSSLSGKGDAVVTISVDENVSANPRTIKLQVSNGKTPQTVTVNQKALPSLVLFIFMRVSNPQLTHSFRFDLNALRPGDQADLLIV